MMEEEATKLCNTPHSAHLASDAKKYSTCFSSSMVKWVKLLTLLILEDEALGEVGESNRWEVYTNVGPLATKSGCERGMLAHDLVLTTHTNSNEDSEKLLGGYKSVSQTTC